MSSELKTEIFKHVSETELFEHVSGFKVVVFASIDGTNGDIYWRGYVASQPDETLIFNEVRGETKKEVYKELAKCMTSYIQTMQALQAYCQQWDSA